MMQQMLIGVLISGYPLVLIHRYSLYCKNPHIQHLYFIASGVSIALFNYGKCEGCSYTLEAEQV